MNCPLCNNRMMVYIRSTGEWVCTRHGRFPRNMFRKDESRKRSNPYTSRVDFYCFLDSLVDEMEKYNWIDEMFAEVEREGTQDLEKVLG